MQLTYDWSKPQKPEGYCPPSDIDALNKRVNQKRKATRERITALRESRERNDQSWDALADLKGE